MSIAANYADISGHMIAIFTTRIHHVYLVQYSHNIFTMCYDMHHKFVFAYVTDDDEQYAIRITSPVPRFLNVAESQEHRSIRDELHKLVAEYGVESRVNLADVLYLHFFAAKK